MHNVNFFYLNMQCLAYIFRRNLYFLWCFNLENSMRNVFRNKKKGYKKDRNMSVFKWYWSGYIWEKNKHTFKQSSTVKLIILYCKTQVGKYFKSHHIWFFSVMRHILRNISVSSWKCAKVLQSPLILIHF